MGRKIVQDETAVKYAAQSRKDGPFCPTFRRFLLSSSITMLMFSRTTIRLRCVPREKKGEWEWRSLGYQGGNRGQKTTPQPRDV